MLKLGMIQMANDNLDTAYVTFTQVLHTRRSVIGYQQPEVSIGVCGCPLLNKMILTLCPCAFCLPDCQASQSRWLHSVRV